MKKKHFNLSLDQHLYADGDLHLASAAQPFDPDAWRESLRTIALEDRRWLRKHRKAEFRCRPISPVEMRMTGHPADTIVTTHRGSYGSQIRCFHLASGVSSRNPGHDQTAQR